MRRHIRWIRIAAVSLVATLVLACTPGGGGSTADRAPRAHRPPRRAEAASTTEPFAGAAERFAFGTRRLECPGGATEPRRMGG